MQAIKIVLHYLYCLCHCVRSCLQNLLSYKTVLMYFVLWKRFDVSLYRCVGVVGAVLFINWHAVRTTWRSRVWRSRRMACQLTSMSLPDCLPPPIPWTFVSFARIQLLTLSTILETTISKMYKIDACYRNVTLFENC